MVFIYLFSSLKHTHTDKADECRFLGLAMHGEAWLSRCQAWRPVNWRAPFRVWIHLMGINFIHEWSEKLDSPSTTTNMSVYWTLLPSAHQFPAPDFFHLPDHMIVAALGCQSWSLQSLCSMNGVSDELAGCWKWLRSTVKTMSFQCVRITSTRDDPQNCCSHHCSLKKD